MHTASDLARRSGNTTRWFRTYADILLYAYRARDVFRGANRVAFGVQRALHVEAPILSREDQSQPYFTTGNQGTTDSTTAHLLRQATIL